jgi:outer membrane immunogenic protein
MLRKALLSSAAFAALTSVSLAADLPSKNPPTPYMAPPVFTWTGFYGGVNVGYAWQSDSVGITNNNVGFFGPAFAAGATPSSYSTNSQGVLGGVQAGYNWQFSNMFVAGLEADISGSAIKGSQSINTTVPGFVPGFGNASQNLDWLGTARVRLGFLPMQSLLVYATGGLAFGHESDSYSFAFPATGELYQGSTSASVGWAVGAGVEYMLTQAWSVKAEYLHYDLGSKNLQAMATGPAPAGSTHFAHFDNNGDLVRVGVNFHF